jgi:hypothetical protein
MESVDRLISFSSQRFAVWQGNDENGVSLLTDKRFGIKAYQSRSGCSYYSSGPGTANVLGESVGNFLPRILSGGAMTIEVES